MPKERIAQLIAEAVQKARLSGDLQIDEMPDFTVEVPRMAQHGDFSCNAAMVLARAAGRKPREVAQIIVANMPQDDLISEVDVAGPGFINLTLRPDWLHAVVRRIISQDWEYGCTRTGAGRSVNLEFVSANPNGPIHMAHARGGALGDSLARVLQKAGYAVTREFYINDALNSLQMQNFALSLVVRFRQLIGQPVELPEDAYAGEYLVDMAQALLDRFGPSLAEGDEDEVLQRFRELAETEMKAQQKRDLEEFGIQYDVWFSEAELHRSGRVEEAIQQILKRNDAYEADGAIWLASTRYGDDKDRVLVRANGQPTYIAADTAYHRDKLERGFDLLIDVWGPDHHGYVARTHAAIAALGYDPNRLEVIIHQIVRVFKGGEMVRMSKRAGNVVTLRDVLDEVGKDATRFFLMMRSSDTGIDFDLELAARASNENPVYYVQYAHARICSILRKADEAGIQVPSADACDMSVLTHPTEVALIKKISELPEEVDTAAAQRAPHRFTRYAMEIADCFHRFYQECRVVGTEPEELCFTHARLLLCQATRITLRNTLDLIGVSAPEAM